MLTLQQTKALQFIHQYFHEWGYCPTLEEIASGIGIKSRGTTSRYINALIDAGYLEKRTGCKRNLQLTDKSKPTGVPVSSAPHIPLIGTIAAGAPIEAIEQHDSIALSELLKGDDLYMLRVQGDSMIEEGIVDGDYVICDRSNTASNGEIVVALIDKQEATLKRIKWLPDNKVALCPANSLMQPMIYECSRVEIQGVLRCQMRTF